MEIPLITKLSVTPPPELSTLIPQPCVPPLGALIAHGPITYGSAAVPLPAVTHAHPADEPTAVRSALEVIVIASCCPRSARASGAPTRPSANALASNGIRQ